MRVLTDSHALIWYVDQPHQLSPAALTALVDPANDLLLSAATVWEVSIKVSLGKLTLSGPFDAWMTQAAAGLGLTLLPITITYADAQSKLPWHHRDPFDRLLVAQSLTELVPVVSADPVLDRYAVTWIW
jgi:PIN domain nuclease of toxin-antitoxin system